MTVTIHLKGGVKQTYLETAVMDDVEARRCVLAYGVTTGNRRNLQGRERNHYGFAEDSHIAYDWNRMNAGNYSERITTARRKILHFIAEDETLQKMTRYEIKRAIDFVYRDISAVFDNVDLAQASSAVITKHGSPAEPDGQESRPASES